MSHTGERKSLLRHPYSCLNSSDYMADEEELARLERKRLKKLAKKQARLQVASGAEEEAVEEPTGDNPDADADAAARKQAKREKKRRRAEEEAALNAEAALLSSGEKVAKKASHGQDGLQHGGATTPAALANVGDHSAAATGSRFRKAFYTECAELAALSQAVSMWRLRRNDCRRGVSLLTPITRRKQGSTVRSCKSRSKQSPLAIFTSP